jgi:hypothetical protein
MFFIGVKMDKNLVVVVEDEVELLGVIERNLRRIYGCDVVGYTNLEDFMKSEERPKLYLVDVNIKRRKEDEEPEQDLAREIYRFLEEKGRLEGVGFILMSNVISEHDVTLTRELGVEIKGKSCLVRGEYGSLTWYIGDCLEVNVEKLIRD